MDFLLPLLLSAGLSAISGGFSAWQRSRENQAAARAQQRRAASLEEAIARMYATDFTSPRVGRASRNIGAGFAGAGLGGSGMASAAMGEAAAAISAEDLARKNSLEMQIRQDQAFSGYSPDDFNPFLNAIIGALGGGAAGVGSAYGSYLGTEVGAANPWPFATAKGMAPMPGTGSLPFSVGVPPVTAYQPKTYVSPTPRLNSDNPFTVRFGG